MCHFHASDQVKIVKFLLCNSNSQRLLTKNLEYVYTDNVVYRQILLEQNDLKTPTNLLKEANLAIMLFAIRASSVHLTVYFLMFIKENLNYSSILVIVNYLGYKII